MITVHNYPDYEHYLQLELQEDKEKAFGIWAEWVEKLIHMGQFDLCRKLVGFMKRNEPAPHNVPVLFYSEGVMNYEAGDKRKALRSYQKAMKAYDAIGVTELKGIILTAIGEIHYTSGEYDLAEETFREAVDDIKVDEFAKSHAKYHLGVLLSEKGEGDEAIRLVKEAYQQFDKDNNGLYIGLSCMKMGSILIDRDEFKKGLAFYRKAEDMFILLNDENAMALMMYNYGLYFLKIKQYENALLGFQNSLELFTKLGDLKRTASVYSALGLIFAKIGEYEKAEGFFLQALQGYEDFGDSRGVEEVRRNMIVLSKSM